MTLVPAAGGPTFWAEDDRSERYLIETVLKGFPHKPDVRFVGDGQELLDAVARARPERVVLDLNMPRCRVSKP